MHPPHADLPDLERTALLVIDVQRGFEDTAFWGVRNNPDCEANIARLVEAWQQADRPIVMVRHDSVLADSPLNPSHPGNAFKPPLDDVIPNLLVGKAVNSSFHGTPDLDAWIPERNLDAIAITGISTNHCCKTTARVGGNLGHQVLFVLDATHSFDRLAPDGSTVTAEELARGTATNLHGEFATVVATEQMLG